jgi:hypothetical protein
MTDDVTNLVIGFGGPIGSGKNTAAAIANRLLVGVAPRDEMGFADAVKAIAREQFGWDGIKDAKGRRLLQVLGTEAGRAYNPDLWVEKMQQAIYERDPDSIILITDCRFPNEVDFCNRHGYTILMANRTTANEGIADHASETSLVMCDWRDVINNAGTLDELAAAVECSLVAHNIIKDTGV